jgi:hypothetical protein
MYVGWRTLFIRILPVAYLQSLAANKDMRISRPNPGDGHFHPPGLSFAPTPSSW